MIDVLAAGDVEAGGAQAHRTAAAAEVLIDHPVRRAERTQQQYDGEPTAEKNIIANADQRQRSVFLTNRGVMVRRVFQRLVPGDLLPFALAAFTDAAQRMVKPPF